MAPTLERRIEPRLEYVYALLLRHETCRNDEHVGIVMFAGQLRDLWIPSDGRTNVGIAIGRIAHPEPGPTQQHAALYFTFGHLLRQRMRVVGVVGGFGATRSEVF